MLSDDEKIEIITNTIKALDEARISKDLYNIPLINILGTKLFNNREAINLVKKVCQNYDYKEER